MRIAKYINIRCTNTQIEEQKNKRSLCRRREWVSLLHPRAGYIAELPPMFKQYSRLKWKELVSIVLSI